MSSPNEPSDKSKPVLKEKNPHNYRKVGYSMIVISVSLVLIGLLVWSIGSNYHFASNIMAGQELTAMTPKAGYQIVLFDYTQPIGAKLKLLDHADAMGDAQNLQEQYAKQNSGGTGQVLVFGTSESDNLQLMANAEVAALTPQGGYNVILFNDALPVGAKLTMGKHDDLFENATKYQQQQIDLIKDPDVKVIIFTSSFTDNLKEVTGSGIPVAAFAAFANAQTNVSQNTIIMENASVSTNKTSTTIQLPQVLSNQTSNSEKTNINDTVSITTSKSVILDEKLGLNTTTSK